MSDNSSIDQAFRNRLGNFEPEVGEAAWERLVPHLPEPGRKKRIWVWILLGGMLAAPLPVREFTTRWLGPVTLEQKATSGMAGDESTLEKEVQSIDIQGVKLNEQISPSGSSPTNQATAHHVASEQPESPFVSQSAFLVPERVTFPDSVLAGFSFTAVAFPGNDSYVVQPFMTAAEDTTPFSVVVIQTESIPENSPVHTPVSPEKVRRPVHYRIAGGLSQSFSHLHPVLTDFTLVENVVLPGMVSPRRLGVRLDMEALFPLKSWLYFSLGGAASMDQLDYSLTTTSLTGTYTRTGGTSLVEGVQFTPVTTTAEQTFAYRYWSAFLAPGFGVTRKHHLFQSRLLIPVAGQASVQSVDDQVFSAVNRISRYEVWYAYRLHERPGSLLFGPGISYPLGKTRFAGAPVGMSPYQVFLSAGVVW
jgi:hypothetical protein